MDGTQLNLGAQLGVHARPALVAKHEHLSIDTTAGQEHQVYGTEHLASELREYVSQRRGFVC